MKHLFSSLFVLFTLQISGYAQLTTTTFNYTGAPQTFVVPSCVNTITVDVQGANGGRLMAAMGGKGGRVQGDLAVTPGDVLTIFVGQAGITAIVAAGGFNGGGQVNDYAVCDSSGTGGGASDIRLNGSAWNNIVVIAGGGGGAGGASSTGEYDAGGDGGGPTGVDGTPWSGWPNAGGKGGTQIAGGAAGVACCSCPTYVTAGVQLTGGTGSGDCAAGGGGGGGYYGGGGSCFSGAGGGSSYAAVSVTSVVHTQGFNFGNGIVKLTYNACTGINNVAVPDLRVNIFPDPFGSSVNVFLTTGNAEMTLFNTLGAKCGMWKLDQGNNTIDTHELPAGVYMLQVRSAAGIITKKVIKQN